MLLLQTLLCLVTCYSCLTICFVITRQVAVFTRSACGTWLKRLKTWKATAASVWYWTIFSCNSTQPYDGAWGPLQVENQSLFPSATIILSLLPWSCLSRGAFIVKARRRRCSLRAARGWLRAAELLPLRSHRGTLTAGERGDERRRGGKGELFPTGGNSCRAFFPGRFLFLRDRRGGF